MPYSFCALTCAIDEDPGYDPRFDHDYDYHDYYSDPSDQDEPAEVSVLQPVCDI